MAHHPTYMPEVEGKLGKDVVKLMLDSARNGDISDSQLVSIADKLGRDLDGPNVIFGNHDCRMERPPLAARDTLLKFILSDWWGAELYNLSSEVALSKLVKVCEDPDVALRPLAKQLGEAAGKQCSTHDTQGEERSSKLCHQPDYDNKIYLKLEAMQVLRFKMHILQRTDL